MSALLLVAAAPAADTASLEIEIVGLRSQKGVVQLCVARAAADFPDCRKGEGAIRRTLPATSPHLRLERLAPGDYAIAAIHDANGNGKLDTMLGIPREGFGFSRDPAIRFGPPRFDAARFTLAPGDAGKQRLRIRYLL